MKKMRKRMAEIKRQGRGCKKMWERNEIKAFLKKISRVLNFAGFVIEKKMTERSVGASYRVLELERERN